MTDEQKDILKSNLESEGSDYTVVTIEYPCNEHSHMKIVTQQANSDQCDVDVYDNEGRTVESRSFFRRTLWEGEV